MKIAANQSRKQGKQAQEVSVAIDSVLAAEADLAVAMQECRTRAEEIVADAQERARSIQRDAERRIAKIDHYQRQIIESQPGDSSRDLDRRLDERNHARGLKVAVDQLAHDLTTASNDTQQQ